MTVLVFVCALAGAQEKYALVIGNANYTSFGSLRNSINDANDMETTLKNLNWTVEKVLNGSLDVMESAVMRLKNRLLGSRDAYGFLYYSGHGVQSNGENYLIPADVNIGSESLLRHRAMPLSFTLDELTSAGNALNVIVLDACRDFPAAWSRSGKKGLTVVSGQPKNSIVVYATSEGATASDGDGRNGLFTAHLLNNLKIPGLEVTELFRRTMGDVARASGNRQFPAVYNQFPGIAYLGSAGAQPAPSPAPRPSPAPAPAPQTIPAGLEWKAEGSGVTITAYTGNASAVNIPERINGLPVTAIGYEAFYGCDSSLSSVVIPSSVTSIGDWAFRGCSGLASVTIPSSVTSIGDSAFSWCSGLTSVTIPSSVTSIGDWAFLGCSGLTSVTIPSSVTSIGGWAFSGCSGLTSVTIPSSVTSIGYYAFSGCSGLTSVTIPSSVTTIGGGAFSFCSGLAGITVDPRNNAYASINGILFDKSGKTLVQYPAGKTGSTYTIPASVTTIGDSAFLGCSGLASVTIPSSVTSIGDRAFLGCSGLTSVTIPSSVTSIGDRAFAYCGLASVTIPSSVTSIGDRAFSGCSGLASVTLSRRTQVGSGAFPIGAQIRYSD
jgi:hypothetical protein